MEQGLEILADVRKTLGVPVLTDVHTEQEVPECAEVVDVLQTPAFLCRQTDFIRAVASAGKPVNIKKGQFLAPWDMKNVVDKAREASGQDNILVCERGASFGYNNLVSDMRALMVMRETGCPVVFDATHSVQLPGRAGHLERRASGSSCRYWPAQRWRPAWRGCSWRRTPIPRRRCPTGRTRGRWSTCGRCWRRSKRSTRW